MPVNTKHPEYLKLEPMWKKCRDAADGQASIHAGKEAYLPRLYKERDDDYKARLARSPFFAATGRTIEALVGMLFRKNPNVEVPTGVKDMIRDVTMSRRSIERFAQDCALEYWTVGRFGILTDHPMTNTDGMTRAQVEALNLRPTMALYKAESVINWEYSWINNRSTLSLVVLRECHSAPKADDRYSREEEERFRVLELIPGDAGDMVYRVSLWRISKLTGKDEQIGGYVFPLMNGKTMDEIPFELVACEGKPPLMALVDTNISHFLTSSDIEHGAHKTALPQPWVAGYTLARNDTGDVTEALYIGGGDAWVFPNPETTVGMLEYEGKGLDALEKRLEVKHKQMAVLGARMLEDQKREVETAEVAGMHRSGEQASLSSSAQEIDDAVKTSLERFCAWAGYADGKVAFRCNREFIPVNMDPAEVEKLVDAWLRGAISKEELFAKFQAGGVVRETTTFEQHETAINNNPPNLLGVPMDTGAAGGTGKPDGAA